VDDKQIIQMIDSLVDEEHQLRTRRQAGQMGSEEEQARLRELEESLDQCWDLLRRRRAARETGGDADQVRPQPRQQVENYLQ
jgi:hypothetical protein